MSDRWTLPISVFAGKEHADLVILDRQDQLLNYRSLTCFCLWKVMSFPEFIYQMFMVIKILVVLESD